MNLVKELPSRIESALDWKTFLNNLRHSIQAKITMPYVLLSMIAALGGGMIISQLLIRSIDQRLDGSLLETGTISKEIIVDQEDDMLETLRLISFISGIDQDVENEQPEALREIILPVIYNSADDAVEILNTAGVGILSIRRDLDRNPAQYTAVKGSANFITESIVRNVIQGKIDSQGDKYADLIEVDGELYLYVAGPIKDERNNLIGVILVGNLVSDLILELRQETAAQITAYNMDGIVIASTLPDSSDLEKELTAELAEIKESSSLIRDLSILDLTYREVTSPLELRGDRQVGYLGVAFSTTFLQETTKETRLNIFGLVSAMLFVIIIAGVYIARKITNPIERLKTAAVAVSDGDMNVAVDPVGEDEIALLTRSFNEMVSNLKESKLDLIEAYDRSLEGWVKALELRDEETEGHTQRVTTMTLEVAQLCGINGTELENIRRGALLHDIGKVGVPDEILNKPCKLTDAEFEVIKQHPWYAYEMLSEISFLTPALDIPYSHHEKWDGSGYPRGLSGTAIPIAARIFSLVDVWDAITSNRPYREAMTYEEALSVIEEGRGSHFDPALTDLFLDYIKKVE